jgi:hypothetical protein
MCSPASTVPSLTLAAINKIMRIEAPDQDFSLATWHVIIELFLSTKMYQPPINLHIMHLGITGGEPLDWRGRA